jgi:hypothetical protein
LKAWAIPVEVAHNRLEDKGGELLAKSGETKQTHETRGPPSHLPPRHRNHHRRDVVIYDPAIYDPAIYDSAIYDSAIYDRSILDQSAVCEIASGSGG